MDAVEALLLCVVGVSVLVFLILDNLERNTKTYDDSENTTIIEYEKQQQLVCEESEFGDDWVGIERSELDKVFGEAMVYVNDCGIEDVKKKMELGGLQQLALQGPSQGSAPSNWNASQDVSREMAMKKYIDILSEAIPHWKAESTIL